MSGDRLSRRGALRIALGLGASALVFGLILRFIRAHASFSPSAFSAPWAAAAVVLSGLQIGLVAYRWRAFTAQLGAPLDYRSALGAYFVSVFLNQLLPFGVIGDALRGVWHSRRVARERGSERAVADATIALVLDRLSGQLVLLALVLAILPLWWEPLRATWPVLAGSGQSLLGLAGVLLGPCALVLWFRRALARRTARARAVFFHARTFAMTSLCSAGALALHAIAFACAARSLGFSLPFVRALRVVPLVLEASALPSFALGAGAREAAAALLYRLLGLASGEGAAVALALGVLGFVASWPGLLLWAVARSSARPTPPSA